MAKLQPKIISLRTSFTADEIVAKMLGWLRGPAYPENIEVTGAHFGEDQLIHLSTLELSLEMHLTQLLNAAMDDYSACGDDVPYEIAIVKEEVIERIEALSKRAMRYVADIKYEIMKGDGSMLEQDPNATGFNGDPCYSLKSADNWAQANFDISIINYFEPVADLLEDTLVVERDGKGSEKGLGKTVTNNFYITFALLIEAFIEANPYYEENLKKMKNSGLNWQTKEEEAAINKTSLVVSKLGEYLSLRSRISGFKEIGGGQSNEAIMTHIKNAMDYKAKVWKARRIPKPQKSK